MINEQITYFVEETSDKTCSLYRNDDIIALGLQLGFAIEQALLLSRRESTLSGRSTHAQLRSLGRLYDLTL